MQRFRTSIERLKGADLESLSNLVAERIGMLGVVIQSMEETAENDKIANDLFLPAFALLAQFVAAMAINDDESRLEIDGAEPPAIFGDISALLEDGERFRALNKDWSEDMGDACGSLDGTDEALNHFRAAIDAAQN